MHRPASEHCLSARPKQQAGRLPRPHLDSSQFKNNHFTEMCSGTEAGSYLRLIDSCITQLKAQGPSRTCNESKKEEDPTWTTPPPRPPPPRPPPPPPPGQRFRSGLVFKAHRIVYHSTLGLRVIKNKRRAALFGKPFKKNSRDPFKCQFKCNPKHQSRAGGVARIAFLSC